MYTIGTLMDMQIKPVGIDQYKLLIQVLCMIRYIEVPRRLRTCHAKSATVCTNTLSLYLLYIWVVVLDFKLFVQTSGTRKSRDI